MVNQTFVQKSFIYLVDENQESTNTRIVYQNNYNYNIIFLFRSISVITEKPCYIYKLSNNKNHIYF